MKNATYKPCISLFLNGADNIKHPSIPDIDPDNKELINETKWIQISNLKDINYVPYIHEQLMEYIIRNRFSPAFIEEPLDDL